MAGQTQLDADLIDQFRGAVVLEPESLLNGDPTDRATQQRLFLRGDNHNPRLDYPDINVPELLDRRRRLIELDKRLDDGLNPLVRRIYGSAIADALRKIALCVATASGDMSQFAARSRTIYGAPRRDLYNGFLEQVRDDATATLYQGSATDEQKICAEQLLERFPALVGGQSVMFLPPVTAEVAQAMGRLFLDFYSDLIPDYLIDPHSDEVYDAERIKQAIEATLHWYGDRRTKIRFVTNRTKLAFDQATMTFLVPQDRKLRGKEATAKIVHELIHWYRRFMGDQSKLGLLGLGLPGYLDMEEAIATFAEQALRGHAVRYAGRAHYLALGLALGYDNQGPRDFRGVYDLMRYYTAFVQATQKRRETPGLAEIEERAREQAWGQCVRIFRGTTCDRPGVCFSKDVVYGNNIFAWQLFSRSSLALEYMGLGKYNLLDRQHCNLLLELDYIEPGDRWW